MADSNKEKNVVEKSQKEIKIVVFSLGDEHYGLKIFQVKEIAGFSDFTPIPNAPEYVMGLIDLRGDIIILVDLQKKFGLKDTDKEKKHIIVCQAGDERLGVSVEGVEGIISLKEKDIRDAEDMIKKKISPEYLSGVAVYDKKVLVVLNMDKLIGKEDIQNISLDKDKKSN